MFGRENNVEIAEFGEQIWYRVAARVIAGGSNFEAGFAGGRRVGKSEIDGTHADAGPL